MKIKDFVIKELQGWGKFEKIIFPLVLLVIIFISLYLKDNKIALISAICGVSYTVLAGKGKISCYLFGLTGTMCYAYISYKNHLYGNLILYSCYYFPMQILGIFKWKNHLNKKSGEIIKTSLPVKEKLLYFAVGLLFSLLVSLVLKSYGDATPFIDGVTTVFSILGMIFTVKRAIEQWYIWTFVNGLSVLMWIMAYKNGSGCFATVLMWMTYLFVGIYFWLLWKKDLKTKLY